MKSRNKRAKREAMIRRLEPMIKPISIHRNKAVYTHKIREGGTNTVMMYYGYMDLPFGGGRVRCQLTEHTLKKILREERELYQALEGATVNTNRELSY